MRGPIFMNPLCRVPAHIILVCKPGDFGPNFNVQQARVVG